MKLPNADRAVVPKAKVTDYLLSRSHRDGRNKARVFTAYGFSAAEWERLARELQRHARDHEVAKREESRFGTRYTVEGPMTAPDGRTLAIRSVWFMETDNAIPRFVTAYPLKRRKP